MCFFFNDTATTEIYTLSLHDALPIYENITLVAINSPDSGSAAIITGGVQLTADGATLKGFEINSGRLSSGNKVGVSVYAPNTEVSYNIINGINSPDSEKTTQDRKSTRLNSSHTDISRMPSSA